MNSPENVPAYLAAVKRREKVLSGFGHRVYKTVRPGSIQSDVQLTFLSSRTRGRLSFGRLQMKCLLCKYTLVCFTMHAFNMPRSTGPDPLLDTAMALHDAAMKDEYFVSRKLGPNVDFWRYEVA